MSIPEASVKYYKSASGANKYAIYNNGLERFMAVSEDLWTVLHAAKLLSSKFSSTVCIISNNDITPENCFNWGLAKHATAFQERQTPVVVLIGDAVEHKGFPVDTTEEEFFPDKEFVSYVLAMTYAMKLTDALCNTGDQHFYNKFFKDTPVTTIIDDSGVANGFVASIEEALYLSSTKDEARAKIREILTDPNSSRPGQLTIYREKFKELLGVT